MRRKGLCFAMPFQLEPDDGLRRFMSAVEQCHHNPWPELIETQALDIAFCQPFVKMKYVPTTKPDWLSHTPHGNPNSSLRQRWAKYHEELHAYLNASPAKNCARIYLAKAYHTLGLLFELPATTGKKNITRIVDDLTRTNERIEEILEQIELSEELLVTALTFTVMERELVSRLTFVHELAELHLLQEEWLSTKSAHVQQLYSGFRKVVRMLYDSDQHSFSKVVNDTHILLGKFLQPIHSSYVRQPEGGTSEERCEKLADYVNSMLNDVDLIDWLKQEISKDEKWVKRNSMGVAMELERYPEGERFLNLLLYLKLRDVEGNDYFPSILVYPREMNSCWYIAPYLWSYEDKFWYSKPSLLGGEDTYKKLLAFEAFRQQLRHGIGIRCPYLLPVGEGICTCNSIPREKKKLLRLAHWATGDKLGDGEWTDLPFPCNTRNF